jgi:sporulation protein YlmC with PRC-barrel domain
MFLTPLVVLILAVVCTYETPKAEEKSVPHKFPAAQSAADGFVGRVAETIKADRYTYVHVDTGTEKIWAATPAFRGKVGDMVVVRKGLAMPNFHSKTLKRDFELVYFVGAIMVMGKGQDLGRQDQLPAGQRTIGSKSSKSQIEVSGIDKVEDGKTVAEIFAGKENLAGKEVLVRGKVVKFMPKIMGKNWLHLQDGSGSEGTNDLTVTTDSVVKVGDLVLVHGVVSADRDFGFGYSYEVIIEDAEVTVE